jgi:hypothetical protein
MSLNYENCNGIQLTSVRVVGKTDNDNVVLFLNNDRAELLATFLHFCTILTAQTLALYNAHIILQNQELICLKLKTLLHLYYESFTLTKEISTSKILPLYVCSLFRIASLWCFLFYFYPNM